MSTHDPISDLITRIRNGQMRAKPKVSTPGSKMRANVLEVLKSEGYIRGYASVEHASGRSELEIELKYFDGEGNHGRPRRARRECGRRNSLHGVLRKDQPCHALANDLSRSRRALPRPSRDRPSR